MDIQNNIAAKFKTIQTNTLMQAILGYIIDVPFTSPHLIELVILNGGLILASTSNNPFHNKIIGLMEDLETNVIEFLVLLNNELTQEEKVFISNQYYERILCNDKDNKHSNIVSEKFFITNIGETPMK